MFLAVIILVGSGIYIFLRRKVQVSGSFAIQGRCAQQIGAALMLGGLLSVVLPALLTEVGVSLDLVSGLILGIAIMLASLICAGVIAFREKRRQARGAAVPTSGNKTRV